MEPEESTWKGYPLALGFLEYLLSFLHFCMLHFVFLHYIQIFGASVIFEIYVSKRVWGLQLISTFKETLLKYFDE